MPKINKAEIWKEVPDWCGYEVSNLGRVRSTRPFRNFAKPPSEPRIMPIKLNQDGYPRVALYGGVGKRLEITVPKLVLTVFVSPKPESYSMALHKNGNKLDNRLSNLYWGTAKQNSDDSKTHGTYVHGTRVNTCVLTDEEARYVRSQKRKQPARNLAKRFGCTIWNIYAIWGGKTWKHLSC